MKHRSVCTAVAAVSLLASMAGQNPNISASQATSQSTAAATNVAAAQVPRLVRFNGTVPSFNANAPEAVVGITFSLYSQQTGGAPLWSEVQNVKLDSTGHYTVQLGATKPDGLPVELFTSAESQWLGVRQEGHAEQARVMLLSVPYALKAADAETFGGKPPSAYMPASAEGSGSPAGVGGVGTPQSTGGSQSAPSVGGSGTTNYIAVWTSSSNLGSSALYQSGINVGIGTTAPTHPLVVIDPSHSGTAISATATGTGGQGIRGVTNSSAGIGIFGSADSTSGGIGVQGSTQGTAGTGVLGNATATTGSAVGVKGSAASTSGYGVFGNATATSGNTYGVYGAAASTSGQAVLGSATATTGNTSGVGGYSASNAGYGVYGENTASSGSTFGTYGKADSTSGTGLVGYATASSGSTLGVWGYVQSSSGTAGLFNNSAGGNILVGQNNSSVKFTLHGNGDVSIAGNYSGGGSGLTGISFGQLVGQLANTQLAGTYSGVLNLSNAGNSYSGSGANLTGLSFQNLSGTLRSSQLSGTYSGALTLSSTSNALSAASVSAVSSSVGGIAVYGEDDTAGAAGVEGLSSSGTGSGVYGYATASSGASYGTYGRSHSSTGYGVYGYSDAASGTAYGVAGVANSTGGTGVYGRATAASGTTWGIYGTSDSTSGTGAFGNSTATTGSTNGVAGYDASNNGYGVAGYATATSGSTVGVSGQSFEPGTASAGVLGQAMATTGTVYGVQGTSVSTGGIGVVGSNTATSGSTYGVEGVVGSPNGFGVYGKDVSTTGPAVGASGATLSTSGVGVYGLAIGASQTTSTQAPYGVWGNTNVNGGVGVLGTNDDGIAVEGANNAGNIATGSFTNNESTNFNGAVLVAHGSHYGGVCLFDVSGDLACNGSKSAVVPVDAGARQVALYAVEAPENWFEDVGSGHLAGGSAVVQLETTFAQTVNTGEEYHVFLTPNGDCKGLYVTNKTAASFEVRELGGGTASIAFDYRIIARRRGYESVRLADNTERFAAIASRDHAAAGAQTVKAPTVPEAGMPPVNQKQFVPPLRQIAVPPAPVPTTRQATATAPPARH